MKGLYSTQQYNTLPCSPSYHIIFFSILIYLFIEGAPKKIRIDEEDQEYIGKSANNRLKHPFISFFSAYSFFYQIYYSQSMINLSEINNISSLVNSEVSHSLHLQRLSQFLFASQQLLFVHHKFLLYMYGSSSELFKEFSISFKNI